MQKTILFLLLILNPILFKSQNISSGLYFAAHNAIKEERTSLILSPEFNALKGFTLDFDIKFRSEEHNYGYVFSVCDAVCADTVCVLPGLFHLPSGIVLKVGAGLTG